jgi:predicted O-methyltransferase YrrM
VPEVRRWPTRTEWAGFVRARLLPIRRLAFVLRGRRLYGHHFYRRELARALDALPTRSDISDHLGLLFFFSLQARPKLIVELGTRGGMSTRSLLAAAKLSGGVVLSIDVEPAGELDVPYVENWRFVQADDVAFGRTGFVDWCRAEGLEPVVDVLFVDTSHQYEHTRREIEVWKQWLASGGIAMFHDTNMGTGLFAHTDGRVDTNWNNERGVIRAIEDLTGRAYDERSFFYDATEEFLVVHFPYCNGLTVLQKSDIGAGATG